MQRSEFEGAKADLRQAASLDPKSKEVREAFNEASKREAASKKSEKAMYKAMFS